MTYLIGTDEAGYGPNLGPLTVSASVWRVPGANTDLYALLEEAVTDGITTGDRRLVIADSKKLYQPKGSLERLELGVLAALTCLRQRPRDWSELWDIIAPTAPEQMEELPWYRDFNEPLPLATSDESIDRVADNLGNTLSKTNIRLCQLRSSPVFPHSFNQGLTACGNKSTLLSLTTFKLIAELLPECPGDTVVLCDKHGGRNRYGMLLQQTFPDTLVEILDESRAESVYRLRQPDGCWMFYFRAGGERFLPAALASMACKYLREVAMCAFNRFWQDRIPGLRATAGYPVDAKRFRLDVQETWQKMKLDDAVFWRQK